MTNSTVVLIDNHPGRSTQTIGIARELGTDPDLIHEPSVGVVGTKGDSQCYMGVVAKVDAIHASLKSRMTFVRSTSTLWAAATQRTLTIRPKASSSHGFTSWGPCALLASMPPSSMASSTSGPPWKASTRSKYSR